MISKLCNKGDQVKDTSADREALAVAGDKLSEAAAALEKLSDPSQAVRLLREEVRDVLVRLKDQHAEIGS